MTNKVICFFHSRDLDGKCSGAIVKKKYPDCELHGIDYGEEFPWDKAKEYDLVFMVDFSLPVKDMITLSAISNLFWVDHHISAIKEYEKCGVVIEGLREVGKAACELTWEYLFPDSTIPRAVRLLGRYDVWDHSDSDALPFQMGARMEDLEPGSEMWDVLLMCDSSQANFHVNQLTEKGKIILKYQDSQNTETCKSNAFEVTFEGLKCIVVNGGFGSRIFKSVWSDKYDMMITFSTNGLMWRVSLYQDGRPNVDCSVIAKKYNGGGHKGAAGFQCEEMPFKIVGNIPLQYNIDII